MIKPGLSQAEVSSAGSYTRLQIRLHWTTLALLVVQWLASRSMPGIMSALEKGQTPGALEFLLSSLHVYCGLIIGCLVVVRLYLRWRHGVPGPVAGTPAIMVVLARTVHYGLYFVLIVMPVSGALVWFEILPELTSWHHRFGTILILLIVVHTAAAACHHWILKDGVLRRIVAPGDRNS